MSVTIEYMNGTQQHLHLSAMQGKLEQRSEAYSWYVERVAESLTLQCAKSIAQQPAVLGVGYFGAEVAE